MRKVEKKSPVTGTTRTRSRFEPAFRTCSSVHRKAASSSSVVLFAFQFKYSGTVRRSRLLDLAALFA